MKNNLDQIEIMIIKIDDKANEIIRLLKKNQKIQSEDVFIDNDELLKILNISKRLLQDWRKANIIPYTQIGNKIFYNYSDIIQLMKSNRIPKK